MTFNRLQLLRNKIIKVERENKKDFLNIKGPSVGELYDDSIKFFMIQVLIMSKEQLIEYLNITNEKYSKIEMINVILQEAQDAENLKATIADIIVGAQMQEGFLCYEDIEITEKEIEKVSHLLKIIMGQKKYDENATEESQLSDDEKRMLALEEKIKKKKAEQQKNEEAVDSKNVLEDIMIALAYEFNLTIEQMMDMNYFTLLWYYSYTGKIHVYRTNQFALSSGMVKKINTDYFTGLK